MRRKPSRPQPLPILKTRRFLHPRRRVTSVFSGLPLHCVAHYPIRLPATRTTRARHTLLLPAIPVHWLPRLAHLPYDLFVHSLLFVKLTAYDSRQQLSPDTRLLSLPLRLPLYPAPVLHCSRSSPHTPHSQCLRRTRSVTTIPVEARSRAWPS